MEFAEASMKVLRHKLGQSDLSFGLEEVLAYDKSYWELHDQLEDLQSNPRDEYHTMDELYHYRMIYNALALYGLGSLGCETGRSRRHHTGELCFDGEFFIVWVYLPTGMVTNHYKLEDEKYFSFLVDYHTAPEWDGHTPQEAARRMEDQLLEFGHGATLS